MATKSIKTGLSAKKSVNTNAQDKIDAEIPYMNVLSESNMEEYKTIYNDILN